MVSVDTVYKTLLTILNKENQGYVSPSEFNLIANNAQLEIFRQYFEDYNRDKNKENRGLTSGGYANLASQDGQRISKFRSNIVLTQVNGVFELPADLYLIDDDGICTTEGKVIDKVDSNVSKYLNCSEASPTETYPIYEHIGNNIKVSPSTITEIDMSYIRTPKSPKWTYVVINNKEMYDPTSSSFQDFELHESEFSNIIHKMLSYFGMNLRESEVIQYAESLKQQKEINDES